MKNFDQVCDNKSKSRSDREKTFTIMLFTFQFFTMFSSLFYIAFFLGRINGYPGNYVRIAGHRLEECHPSGCLTDLFIQMFVIMTLSQFFRNISEFTIPDKHSNCWNERCDDCLLKYWQDNYKLADTDDHSLFYEILKMVIQFSFTTLFVAAFPLAPLLALINNIGSIRLAAIRMVRLQRLLSNGFVSVGVWTNVLEAIGVLAVITNGLVIGITSDFIPRLVYQFGYGPCANGVTNTHCMSGYINSTLTMYTAAKNMEQFNPPSPLLLTGNLSVTWHRWEQRFQLYMTATGALEKDEKVKHIDPNVTHTCDSCMQKCSAVHNGATEKDTERLTRQKRNKASQGAHT
uniref:Anoctamin n=1 Tax=Oryzias latipes TaxID=8090 RepID=A0A3P9HYJ3_ORYLA